MPCPRWDSNAILGLVDTGKWRKHAESGPVRRLYGAVRGERCAHRAHFLICPFAGQRETCRTARRTASGITDKGRLAAIQPQHTGQLDFITFLLQTFMLYLSTSDMTFRRVAAAFVRGAPKRLWA